MIKHRAAAKLPLGAAVQVRLGTDLTCQMIFSRGPFTTKLGPLSVSQLIMAFLCSSYVHSLSTWFSAHLHSWIFSSPTFHEVGRNVLPCSEPSSLRPEEARKDIGLVHILEGLLALFVLLCDLMGELFWTPDRAGESSSKSWEKRPRRLERGTIHTSAWAYWAGAGKAMRASWIQSGQCKMLWVDWD